MRIFTLMIVLFLSSQVKAEDYSCPVEKQNVTKILMQDVQCTHDEECGWFDYGYPWQPGVCAKAIVNITKENHNIANLRLISEYDQHCIANDPAEKTKYDEFAKKLSISACKITRTYCYKGFCRIKNYATYFDK